MVKRRKPTEYIIVHCSDTPPVLDYGVEEIRRWHREERGWTDIGYHYVIRRNGKVEVGRPKDTIGAHCLGLNDRSVGICLIGGKAGPDYYPVQYKALEELIRTLKVDYPQAIIRGHNDFTSAKRCPCFDVKHWAKSVGLQE